MVGGEIDVVLELPGLTRDEAFAGSGRAEKDEHRRHPGVGAPHERARERLEGGHDEGVADQDGHRLTVRAVDRRAAAPCGRVVEARQVVVHERRAVEELDRAGGGVGKLGARSKRLRDLEAKARAHTSAAREHRVVKRLTEPWRLRFGTLRSAAQGVVKGSFEDQIHHREGEFVQTSSKVNPSMDKSWTRCKFWTGDEVTERAPTVIIGAGFGGLAAAVELALRGERVVVVERENVPGGKARTVDVGGRAIDVGPTVLTMRWVFDAMFAAAGQRLDDVITLTPASVIARHAFGDGSTLDLFADLERSCSAVAMFAGEREAAAYRRFAAQGEATAVVVRGPFLESERPSIAALLGNSARLGLRSLARVDAHRTMWRALTSTFADPRLRALFGRYATYVGSSPFDAPATLNLIAHVEREGVSVVQGGMSQLARAVAELASELGVTFRYGSRVREITVKHGRVSGVVLEGPGEARDVLAASAVIANADVATLASGALGHAARNAASAPRNDRRSLSAITWAIVGRASGFPLAHHNVFFSGDYPAEFEALFGQRRLAADPTVYVCAQDRVAHDEPAPDGDERLFVIVNAPATADTTPLTSEEVERCERAMFSRLSKAGLSIAPRAMVVTTPSSFGQLAPGTGGAIYGEASHGPFSALARPSSRTKLPGLFLAGGSVHPGPGVPMAALSGRTAARAVLRDLASTSRSRAAAMVGSTSME